MRALVQRVKQATVTVNETVVGKINQGLLVFLGVCHTDTEREANWMAQKIAKLRIFEHPAGGVSLGFTDLPHAELLLVSQFTLYGSVKGNNRPSFTMASGPVLAEQLYNQVGYQLEKALSKPIQYGQFAAMMDVQLVNDGPFTIWIDTAVDLAEGAKVVKL